MWRRLRGEDGMTLTELMVVMALLGIVITAVFSVLASVQKTYVQQADRSQSNDQVRLAAQELDREIRSGNVFYDPAAESDATHGIYPNMSLRVYTQSNGNVRTPTSRCVQWRIYNEQLQQRWWTSNWRDNPSTLVSGWRVVADHVLNRSLTPQVPAFTLDTSQAAFGNRIVNISFVVNQSTAHGQPVRIDTSVTGRDTEFGFPTNICNDIPSY